MFSIQHNTRLHCIVIKPKVEPIYHTAGNFCQEIFLPTLPPALIGKNLSTIFFFSCTEDYIADMVIFTTLVKILSLKIL